MCIADVDNSAAPTYDRRVFVDARDDADREWNEWYNGEYVPGYRKVRG